MLLNSLCLSYCYTTNNKIFFNSSKDGSAISRNNCLSIFVYPHAIIVVGCHYVVVDFFLFLWGADLLASSKDR